jgi:excisionase family DNA binding protein
MTSRKDKSAGKTGKPAPPRYDDLPDLVTPEDAEAFLQCSRNQVYALLKTQKIRSLRFGRLIRIPKAALMEGN